MNWKNVAHLIRVDMKSGRLLRGRRLTRYREHRLFNYLAYGGALVLGLVIGGLVGVYYASAAATDPGFCVVGEGWQCRVFFSRCRRLF